MKLEIDPNALEDLRYWQKKDKNKLTKIYKLIEIIQKTPFVGEGKPEPLKYNFAKCWSRRIDRKHRLVYRVEKNSIVILQCRFHY
jgi:toxin YoeB